MGLAPGEQRTLSEIESQLCRSDPELAAMFACLTDRAPRPSGLSVRTILLIAVGGALIVACLAVALVNAAYSVPRLSGRVLGAGPAISYSAAR